MSTTCLRTTGLSFLGLIAAGLPSASAQSVWNNSDGQYLEASNWDPAGVPATASGGHAVINAGNVIYTAGPDLAINNGGSLTINGGSWTQEGGISWIQLGGGSLVVAGGTFNQGTSGNIVRNADSSITVSSGVANFTGNLLFQNSFGSLAISGTGRVNVEVEFKPIDTFTLTGGVLHANLISFADGPGGINLNGGILSVNGAAPFNGFYGGGPAKGVNFDTNSQGTLFFSNFTEAGLIGTGYLTNGTIQYNGGIDAGQFFTWEADGGVYVNLTGSIIPEPSSYAALVGLAVLGFAAGRRRRD